MEAASIPNINREENFSTINPLLLVFFFFPAKYSKPTVSKANVSTLGLSVTCQSHGGYPSAEFTWNISGNEDWRVIKTKNTNADKLTQLLNVTSTVFINCSGVERSVSCSVADSASHTFQVCECFAGSLRPLDQMTFFDDVLGSVEVCGKSQHAL